MRKKTNRHVLEAVAAYKKTLDDHRFVGDGTLFNSMIHGIPRNSLQVVFKELYGVNIRNYKLQVRMERAHELLKQGSSVKKVSVLLRYTTARAFVTAFKKQFGVSPGQWRDAKRP
jgi:AraC-like DNA-binding protein